MTEAEQLQRMRREILGDKNNFSKDDDFRYDLVDAKNVFLNEVYPFDVTVSIIPERYQTWQVECAIEIHYLKEDGDYSSYSENGLSWSKSEGISKKLLDQLPPPKAGVPL